MSFGIGGNGQWNQNYNWLPTEGQLKNSGSNAQNWKNAYTSVDTLEQLKKFSNSSTFEGSQYIIQGDLNAARKSDGSMGVGKDDFFFMNNGTTNFSYGNGPAEAGDGKKYVFGNELANTITTSNYSAHVQAGNGDDTVNGSNGNDQIWGEGGNDKLNGGKGRDVLYGNQGNDTMNGGAGDDLLLGDEGNDTLQGGDGADYVFGGKGNDIMSGGKGADRFYLSELSGSGTKIKDFKAGEGDNIWIIDNKGKKADYQFVQIGNDVQIKNKNGTVMATVENAKVDDVKAKTQVGASRFEGYADTTPERRNRGEVSTNPPTRSKLKGLGDIEDLVKSAKPTKTFELKSGTTTEIEGFAYSAGQRLKFGEGIDAKDLTIKATLGKVTVMDGDKELAVITPPKGTRDLETWVSNVRKSLKEIGVPNA